MVSSVAIVIVGLALLLRSEKPSQGIDYLFLFLVLLFLKEDYEAVYELPVGAGVLVEDPFEEAVSEELDRFFGIIRVDHYCVTLDLLG